MCNCIQELEEKVKNQLTNMGISEDDIEDCYAENKFISFTNGKQGYFLNIKASYYQRKTNGDRYKRATNKDFRVTFNYCPLCGEKAEGVE